MTERVLPGFLSPKCLHDINKLHRLSLVLWWAAFNVYRSSCIDAQHRLSVSFSIFRWTSNQSQSSLYRKICVIGKCWTREVYSHLWSKSVTRTPTHEPRSDLNTSTLAQLSLFWQISFCDQKLLEIASVLGFANFYNKFWQVCDLFCIWRHLLFPNDSNVFVWKAFVCGKRQESLMRFTANQIAAFVV